MINRSNYTEWFEHIGADDVNFVGGKNASLGEMISSLGNQGIQVPGGFATTATAYWVFIDANDLRGRISELLDNMKNQQKSLEDTGKAIRRLFLNAMIPEHLSVAIRNSYRDLGTRYGKENVDVAVRSSATAEDLPGASFAGQQETFLNVTGEDDLMDACKRCYASLFTDRAIVYRENQGFDHMKVALSIGIQKMVRADKAGAGVMFTLDTDTGFRNVTMINASWGLGENVVQGKVNPDQYTVFKPLLDKDNLRPIIEKNLGTKEIKRVYSTFGTQATKDVNASKQEQQSFVLNDDEILTLGKWSVIIEKHYNRPMDIEWAKDGETGNLYIVQARPETVQSRRKTGYAKIYTLAEKGKKIIKGLSIGQAIASGKVKVIRSPHDMDQFEDKDILVTGMTDPDWVPIMKRAAGIITDQGGRTSHAAIVSRELGVPAIVGTENATHVLKNEQEITMSCAEGEEGYVYEERLHYEISEINYNDLPRVETPRILINIASPSEAFNWWQLPVRGIGLARIEFIISDIIKIHPMALARFEQIEDRDIRKQIEKLTTLYPDKSEYFIDHLSRGIAKIAASQYPHRVIVRMSDFKSNEYANLIGGKLFEYSEPNPMLGFRGASRYYNDRYRDGFALECMAVKRARDVLGLSNIAIMIPFCRTLEEADKVLNVLSANDLNRGENGLQIFVMCEIPSNVILATRFAEKFDGFSIGSNDLTQLVLGVDRDSAELSGLFNEENDSIKIMIRDLINKAHQANREVSICGQAPSDLLDFDTFLVQAGIDSISINPDSFAKVIQRIAEVEQGRRLKVA
ncbi:MAG: phosphoenolpyruvate synthase [Candidatus Margulisiibacteriota bacterium]|nr:MAG: phosphoenolpyruvate synthase [Candidatus Margulisbacteria bacterium GWF2_38_17]OGI07792.1 MAG: phosphoenolpyruvate synthase [Candidatus Margulisbacteria bacterium GWE2_39_32]PZM84841.1 MAG: phosphoenolpyruvate synthase [Candidatus Margulisiibacteriota bacterium]HCT85216.1 phosphoenolpyruvate synthase [Candidatus Margulisiibacteriota bacterium]HCY36354.1 phosphoenolpyruvate synthase [Candidatus Margulisiibacteriota bacterium]